MTRLRSLIIVGSSFAFAACGAQSQDALLEHDGGTDAAEIEAATPADVALACSPRGDVTGRTSPYDSAVVSLATVEAKVCYSRPSMRGRVIFGPEGSALVPYGQLWRTGANEPTTLHLSGAAEVAGVAVEAGSYSIYTVPGEAEWTVIVNRSTEQWGIESQYTPEIEAMEVGRAAVRSETMADAVELFTIRFEPAGADAADLVLEWERTRVRVPVAARAATPVGPAT